ncbi:MAG: hypothetical protein KGI68_10250 [Alphaproteobacteria bacterium]|nr:hypothetical protein [Alphaproteobacteria bacterium]MDE1985621.1 hypothetical protein [Alphaproteobacteria bacterium]MDE2162242.1 hypothetical protein [Alphaproteobacteria bacterium]MDE2501288.1 hypothetical protein [Alphaproteobacteria bacterium]
MTRSISDFLIGALIAAAACVPSDSWATASRVVAPGRTEAPAGTNTLDKAHASLIFRASHLGFLHFTARMSYFDVTLQFDPRHPDRSQVADEKE